MSELLILFTAFVPIIIIMMQRTWRKKMADKFRRFAGSKKAEEAHKKRDSGKFTRGMGRMVILFAVFLSGCVAERKPTFTVFAFEGTEVVRVYKGKKPGLGDQIETADDLEFVNWDGWVLQDDVIDEIRKAVERGEIVELRLFQPGEHIFFEGDAWIEQKEDRWRMKEGGAFHSDEHLKEVMRTKVRK